MIININTNEQLYFKQYLTIMNTLSGNKLTIKEINVTAELNKMLYTLLAQGNPVPTALKLLLDYDNMITMRSNLEMTEVYWRNLLTCLRKKNVLAGKTLTKAYIVPIVNEITLKFIKQRQLDNNLPVLHNTDEGSGQEETEESILIS